MKVDILSEGPVSPNFAAANAAVSCVFCASAQLQDAGLLCLYRAGAGKHSTGGKFVAQRSDDMGQTWSDPIDVFDGSGRSPVWVASMPGVCQTRSGRVIASLGVMEGLGANQH